MPARTLFAPAERATPEQVGRDALILTEAGLVDHITYAIPSILMVLNKERQLVYTNRRLLELLDISSTRDVLGLRPGEILDCIHAHNSDNGCGTTEFCRECGAVNAILDSQEKQIGIENECRITTASGKSLDLRVWASPCNHENTGFTIFSVIDIHHEKRRQVLEGFFFHDAIELASIINRHSIQLEKPKTQWETTRSIEAIRMAAEELSTKLWSYRKLAQAEGGELKPEPVSINSFNLLNELTKLGSERSVVLQYDSDDFNLATDRTLLSWILLNMLKNAIEATAEGEIITIACKLEKKTGIFSIHNPNFMPRPVQLQIFQRSFSTKGKGHGIGTYSMRLLGEKFLKGKVGFHTSKEKGTTFHIALPLVFPET